MTKSPKILVALILTLIVVVGSSAFFIVNKVNSLMSIVDKDSAKKENELSRLFFSFSKEQDLNRIARIFSTGCNKPANFSSLKIREPRDGFRIKCEIYNDGKPVIQDNIDFEQAIDVDIFLGAQRGYVESIRLSADFPNAIEIPHSIYKYATAIGCEDGSFVGGKNFYKISLPSTTPFFALHEWSCGSGGCWNTVEMSRVSQVPKIANGSKLLNPGDHSTAFPDSGWICK
jgi:hypothetical protein